MFNETSIRAGLEVKGVRIVDHGERPAGHPQARRLIRTTFYRYGVNPSPETKVRVIWSVWPDYAARNAWYALSQNKYEAGVAEVVDTGTFDELHAILTRDIGGNIYTAFKRDPMRPKLLLPDLNDPRSGHPWE